MCVHSMCSLSRRRALFAGVASATLAAFSLHDARADQASTGPAPNAIAPSDALARLLQGNNRYAANMPENKDYPLAGRRELRRNIPLRRLSVARIRAFRLNWRSIKARAICSS